MLVKNLSLNRSFENNSEIIAKTVSNLNQDLSTLKKQNEDLTKSINNLKNNILLNKKELDESLAYLTYKNSLTKNLPQVKCHNAI